MNVPNLPKVQSRWFKDFAVAEGFKGRGQPSVRRFFGAIYDGQYTIVRTPELKAMQEELTILRELAREHAQAN